MGKQWKNAVYGDYSQEIKRCLQPRQYIKHQRHCLPTKVHLIKAMVFPVVVYRCESCTTKKAECWRIDAFELWCWRRLLRVPWIARRSNQSILKEVSPEYSLEGLMLRLKLRYFGHLMWRTNLFEMTLMLGSQRVRHDWVTELNLQPYGLQHARLQSFTHSLLKFMSIESMMPPIQPSHPLFSLLLLPSICPSIGVFSSKPALHIRGPKY